MAVIDLVCPSCHADVFAPDRLAGQTMSCRRCQGEIHVPGAPDAPLGAAPVPGGSIGMPPGSMERQQDPLPGGPLGMPGGAQAASHETLPGGALGLADPPPRVEPQFAGVDEQALHDPRFEFPQPPEPDRTVPAILGAVGGAVLGAILWAAIGAATGYEIGWIAWGIGAGVGWCAAVLGGRGQVVAIACAVLTLAAIFGGKFAAVAYVIPREIESAMAAMISPAMYAEHETDAAAYAALGAAPSTDDVRGFMIAHGWIDGGDGWEIADAEVDAFTLHVAPDLVAFQKDRPAYEVWRDRAVDEAVGAMMQEVSTIDVLKESLSPIDFLWVLLGVSSAFGLIMRRSQ